MRVDHVNFGVIQDSQGKRFKTRSGDSVRLRDLLDEGVRRADALIREKALADKSADRATLTDAEIASVAEVRHVPCSLPRSALFNSTSLMCQACAYGCIKYYDLVHDRTSDYQFSFDKMLDVNGDTAIYLLYALTRIRSVLRQPELASLDFATLRRDQALSVAEPAERGLVLHLLKWPDVVATACDTLSPHHVANFLYRLSRCFTDFWGACYVITRRGDVPVVDRSRVLLCEATATVMSRCLDILGVSTDIHRM